GVVAVGAGDCAELWARTNANPPSPRQRIPTTTKVLRSISAPPAIILADIVLQRYAREADGVTTVSIAAAAEPGEDVPAPEMVRGEFALSRSIVRARHRPTQAAREHPQTTAGLRGLCKRREPGQRRHNPAHTRHERA